MLEKLLYQYIQDPENPESNYNLAIEYKNIGQTSAAVSFFLRCADRSGDDLELAYECLIHIGDCFDSQKNRDLHAYGAYKQAISILPKRPEAYYYICRLKNWNSLFDDGYNYSSIALSVCEFEGLKPLRNINNYTGKHCLLFEKALSSWHWGKIDECKEGFLNLHKKYLTVLSEYQIKISRDYLSNYFNIPVNRADIINRLIKKINAKKYLEIGVDTGQNLNEINCEYKIGIDPNVNTPATFHITSDEFFEKNKETFDIIFIDGLHHDDQVLKDILNSLEILNDGGYIICHDMNPIKEEHQYRYPYCNHWNGDCWKAFVYLRQERDDLEMCVIDVDHGCGIIKRGKQSPIKININISYKDLDNNRKYWLNLIDADEFEWN